MKKFVLIAIIAACAVTALVSTALALNVSLPVISGDSDKPSLGSLDDASQLGAFRKPFTADASERSELSNLTTVGKTLPEEASARGIDQAKARPTRIPGSNENVWIAPTKNGKICLFVPANGGYNTACGSPEEVRTTGLASVSGGADGAQVAVIVGPNGAVDPVVHSKDGRQRVVRYVDNVSVTVLAPGDTVDTGTATLRAAELP